MKIVILGYRVAGLDGVSLETEHWRTILEDMGHHVTLVAGELDRAGILVPELSFRWPHVAKIHDRIAYGSDSYEDIKEEIGELSILIEKQLRKVVFSEGKSCDVLIVPNVFSLPMHFPLSRALSDIIQEYQIPTLARHHDFWWERYRYLNSSMFSFFEKWFPPKLPTLYHTVINSISQYELKKREGIESTVISDSFNFQSDLNKIDSYSANFRTDFGVGKDDIIFLQATRVVPRKRIEIAIDFVKKLGDKRVVFIAAGHEGDEAGDYLKLLKLKAKEAQIRALFIGDRVSSARKVIEGQRHYTLWDCFANADFSTYPTQIEGFGNQFVESVYFKKPIILTPYHVFKSDIAPLGFDVITLPDKVTKEAVEKVRELIKNPKKKKRVVENNFKIGKENFSYEATAKKIRKVFRKMGLES